MITVNGVDYYSRYKPADKRFFQQLHETHLILERNHTKEERAAKMELWNQKWDLCHRKSDAEDILEDNPHLRKECLAIIRECDWHLQQFSDDPDEVAAYQEVEQ
jgi:hypothetical protein